MVSARVVAALLLAAGPAAADVFMFETPSGNIDCSVGVGEGPADISCTIHERNGPFAAPPPADCVSNWGHSFRMGERGRVEMVCEELRANTRAFEVAPYGVRGTWGGLTCLSERSGLQCQNADGHGFHLSRARQQVF